MGRSVSTPTAAEVIAYAHIDSDGDADLDQRNWDDDMVNLGDTLRAAFPSLRKADRWLSNEDHVILENQLAAVTVSEYCGLVAVCLVPDKYEYGCQVNDAPLSVQWIENVEARFRRIVAQVFGIELQRMGTMSNGESIFKRIGA